MAELRIVVLASIYSATGEGEKEGSGVKTENKCPEHIHRNNFI